METVSLSRRSFLRGRPKSAAPALRPPWALAEADFLESCTRCSQCISACPTQILVAVEGSYPGVDFRRGECTFCGDCVRACGDGALSIAGQATPWKLHIEIGDACLARQRIVCRSCADACEPRAIGFSARAGGVASPELDAAACTGCGACINTCPTDAIRAEAVPDRRNPA